MKSPILAILFILLVGITIFTPESIIELNSHIFGKSLLLLLIILTSYQDLYAGLFTCFLLIYVLHISNESFIENLKKMKKNLTANEIFESNGISGSAIPATKLDRVKLSNEIRKPKKAKVVDKNDVLNDEEIPISFMPINIEQFSTI
tara:strand:- start:613 stop:1053 length:441 start_codon:yes stop_codon:yes gene_type:complete